MRSAADIRSQILRLKYRLQLPLVTISERSNCSLAELQTVFRFEASEETLRRLDAFLDAPKLHKPEQKETAILYQIEELDRELYREYGVHGPHPLRVQRWSVDKQKRYIAMRDFRAKCCFVQMIYVETGLKFKIPDGQTYWQFKVKCLRRAEAVRPRDGNHVGFPGPRSDSAESRL